MGARRRRRQGQTAVEVQFFDDIHNNVKQIQDYYASILGEFEALVLMSLVRLGNGAYGATILRDIRARAARDVAIGTLYMTLGRLERKKLIVSYVGSPRAERGGRRRRHYLIADPGERALGRAYRTFIAMSRDLDDRLAVM
jgi:DNA-binding PadR family transcriptional regulator